jgi:hypothetical protein
MYKDYPSLSKKTNSFITGSNVFHLNNIKIERQNESIRESKFGLWASEFLVCTFLWTVAVAEKS